MTARMRTSDGLDKLADGAYEFRLRLIGVRFISAKIATGLWPGVTSVKELRRLSAIAARNDPSLIPYKSFTLEDLEEKLDDARSCAEQLGDKAAAAYCEDNPYIDDLFFALFLDGIQVRTVPNRFNIFRIE